MTTAEQPPEKCPESSPEYTDGYAGRSNCCDHCLHNHAAGARVDVRLRMVHKNVWQNQYQLNNHP